MNMTIVLDKDAFMSLNGIFTDTYAGHLTHIVQRF